MATDPKAHLLLLAPYWQLIHEMALPETSLLLCKKSTTPKETVVEYDAVTPCAKQSYMHVVHL